MTPFVIRPLGAFSLAAAIRFAAGWPPADFEGGEVLRLAFVVDDFSAHAGVALRQDGAGDVVGDVVGSHDMVTVERQVARILGLDADGRAYLEIGNRDEVVGRLQERYQGLRPVCFHSPYEAAVWSVLSNRIATPVARRLRTTLCEAAGTTLEVDGASAPALPLPTKLLALEELAGLPAEKMRRLHGVAEAALAGDLDAERLRSLPPEVALASLKRIRGIGDFYAGLILIRGAAMRDYVLPEPRLKAAAEMYYGPGVSFEQASEGWRPFRTWVAVLLRSATE